MKRLPTSEAAASLQASLASVLGNSNQFAQDMDRIQPVLAVRPNGHVVTPHGADVLELTPDQRSLLTVLQWRESSGSKKTASAKNLGAFLTYIQSLAQYNKRNGRAEPELAPEWMTADTPIVRPVSIDPRPTDKWITALPLEEMTCFRPDGDGGDLPFDFRTLRLRFSLDGMPLVGVHEYDGYTPLSWFDSQWLRLLAATLERSDYKLWCHPPKFLNAIYTILRQRRGDAAHAKRRAEKFLADATKALQGHGSIEIPKEVLNLYARAVG